MQIVIDIPETMIQELKDGCFGVKHNVYELAGCIMNGTPLPPHGDLISKQYLLDNCVIDKVTMPYVPISRIQEAPPVNPQEPKIGHWIAGVNGHFNCSECNTDFFAFRDIRAAFIYCPYCGAKMVDEQESEG